MKEQQLESCDITLTPFDNKRLLSLCGNLDEHIRQIESRLNVEIKNRANAFHIIGSAKSVSSAKKVVKALYNQTEQNNELTPNQVHLTIQEITSQQPAHPGSILVKTPNINIKPRTENQAQYLNNILNNEVNFGIGPAGTGKTYLAVACAVSALEKKQVRRIILVRPVVEAGERLGFLPGDLAQKIDPYLRPLYDALHEMLGPEKVNKLLENQVIEIAPLAYMRGRTLSDSFIILDESQNTTIEQMKMFLTRLGFGSNTVITGDATQIDLPNGKISGLKHALKVLKNVPVIKFNHFTSEDVIRHPVVQQIIDAYDKNDKQISSNSSNYGDKKS